MIKEAARLICESKHLCAFTGAGISVESGIPPFRGPGGLWNSYNPDFIEINHFYRYPTESWQLIKEIFYDFFGQASPNAAHIALANLEKMGLLKAIITQNIDNLHQTAGSTVVHEFHGTLSHLVCLDCHKRFRLDQIDMTNLPPECPECVVGLIKPDFIFFGEDIPEPARSNSLAEARNADVMIVVGTTGEVMPACTLPYLAQEKGARIIEVNIAPSAYTGAITDIFLQGPATAMLKNLVAEVEAITLPA